MSTIPSTPAKQRIIYIDYLKGLTILWVVWYHTTHPDFVEFSFRIPLFFFVSGIFFKPYEPVTFLKKKVNTLLVPFVLFYLIYYFFLIGTWTLSGRGLSTFDFSSIFSVFHPYRGNESFVVNPPLWFIFSLINLQILLYILICFSIPRKWTAILAIALSLAGSLYLYQIPTLFMWSRCLRYFVYYAFGYLFGKSIISIIEGQHGRKSIFALGGIGLSLFLICWQAKDFLPVEGLTFEIVNYLEIMSLILFMIYFLKYLSPFPFLRFLNFYGKNSYIVLGMHEIILTSLLLAYQRFVGNTPDILGGLTLLLLTTIILWPVIILFNKVFPKLVGKEDLWK